MSTVTEILSLAVRSENVDRVKKLLASGVEISSLNSEGYTALHEAVQKKNTEIIGILLDSKASLITRDKHGYTATEMAAKIKADDIVQFIKTYKPSTPRAVSPTPVSPRIASPSTLADLVVDLGKTSRPETASSNTNRPVGSAGGKKRKGRGAKALIGFHKFRNDNDLLLESLSFIHISEYLQLQLVCKRWQHVLSNGLRSMHHMKIHSRTGPMLQMKDDIIAEEPTPNSATTVPDSPTAEKAREVFHWSSSFVLAESVANVLRFSTRSLTQLTMTNVVLNLEIIGNMSVLAGRLRSLSLGMIKMDDSPVVEPEKFSLVVPVKGATPGFAARATRILNNRPLTSPAKADEVNFNMTGRSILGGRRPVTSSGGRVGSPTAVEKKKESAVKKVDVQNFRYMNGNDVKAILFSCGSELIHLELSITIGDLPDGIFRYTPKLISLTATDTLLAPKIQHCRHELEGCTEMDKLQKSLQGVKMPVLLSLMSDAVHESLLLADKRGNIAVANEAWERMTGYKSSDVTGLLLDILQGPLTDVDAFQLLFEGFLEQSEPTECTTFLYHASGKVFMCQIILLPNISKYRGYPLDHESLSHEFLGQLALEEESSISPNKKSNNTNVRNKFGGARSWLSSQKDLSYHLVRFGNMSECFSPSDFL